MATAIESKEGILKQLRDQGDQFRSLGVRRLGLFGSLVRREETRESDVDAGVALAAVQQLALRVEALERDNERLRNELEAVRSSR